MYTLDPMYLHNQYQKSIYPRRYHILDNCIVFVVVLCVGFFFNGVTLYVKVGERKAFKMTVHYGVCTSTMYGHADSLVPKGELTWSKMHTKKKKRIA